MVTELNTVHPGIVMVKPHAYERVLDQVIDETLRGFGVASDLHPEDRLNCFLDSLTIGEPMVRDLRVVPYGVKLIELFYGDKSNRRYCPLIMQHYVGKVAFLPYIYRGEEADLDVLHPAIKGTTETFDANGDQVDSATGIRRLFGEPYQFVSHESSLVMDDHDYERCFLSVVNNYIHVYDSRAEINKAFSMLEVDCLKESWTAAL